MTRVGFTGTQVGMTGLQKTAVLNLLKELQPTEFHHGDCVGADEEAHSFAKALGLAIVIHPPDNPGKRAWCDGFVDIRQPKAYLVRNQEIVDDTEVLIATPKENTSQLRSGTWATIRRGMKANRIVYIVYPDGFRIVANGAPEDLRSTSVAEDVKRLWPKLEAGMDYLKDK